MSSHERASLDALRAAVASSTTETLRTSDDVARWRTRGTLGLIGVGAPELRPLLDAAAALADSKCWRCNCNYCFDSIAKNENGVEDDTLKLQVAFVEDNGVEGW